VRTEPKTLTVGDDSDPLLWFNVQKATGDYKYTVVTKAGVTYVATLNWTAPAEVDAVKTGDPAYNQERENWYQLYTVEVDVDPEDSKVYQIKPDGEISELTVLADADNHLNIWFRLYGKDGEQQEGEHIFLIKKGDTWSKAVIDYGLVEVTRADGDVTQDTGKTGGTELSYNFVAEGKKLTIDANNTKLPYYETDGSTPPRTANWVGVAIPIPEGVNTEEVTATINGKECVDLFFADGKYMEYIDVKADDLTEGAATYEWVIKWGAGYADETITIELINVAGLEAPEVEVTRADGDVTQDAGKTGGTELSYNFVAEGKKLTIDANNTKLPYYEADGSTPPRTANWVGVAIPIPEGVNTGEVTATINGTECVDLFFADGKYMEYIDVKADDLTEGAATYEWVIKWGAGYADETITIELINVAGLEAPEEEPEDPAEAKAAFIAAFNDIIDDIQVEGKTVANAAMTGEDITVTFKTSDAAEILAGAGVVFEALQELAEAESSITINDQKFNLDEELSISALANAILGDGGIEGFLEDKTITVTYTATVFNKNGTEFSLTGNLTFNLDVEEEPEDPAEAKAAFIAAFNDIIDDIQVEGKTVANAAMTGEDITVTFKTSDAAEILAGAGVVFEALQELAEAESSITINDQKFNLDEELSISALANAILGDGGIEGFLEDKTITVTYTATVFNKSGTEFSLTGNLTFNLDVEDAQK
jgi:predicted RNA-binding protein Jag